MRSTDSATPLGSVRDVVRELWKNLLEIDDITDTDNFFDLGGDSLLAVEFTSAIEDALGVEYDLGDFFDAPTLGEVVSALE
jgi:acyl carrier protein